MIAGIFHKGSGLGNQLHRYVATRVLALDKGYDFSMVAPELFKGKNFMDLDMGDQSKPVSYFTESSSGRVWPNFTARPIFEEWDKHCYDPDINFVEDNTIIDGNFEDSKYFEHRLPEISEWLKTEKLDVPDDTCLIGFRGGEYYAIPELGLPKEYYDRAIAEMLKINPDFKFEVHTDDPTSAKQFFPDYKIVHDTGINWRSIRYAKYAIIANSSFYVLPRLLRHNDDSKKFSDGGAPDIRPFFSVTIAPRYFNRYNVGRWDYPQFYYKKFKYI